MKRLYSLLVIVMLLTSSFIIGLNEDFAKAANPSVFILRTCDGRTVYYEGEKICLEIIVNNPYDTPLEFDDLDHEIGAINVDNSTLITTLRITFVYEINSTVIPPHSYGILFNRFYYPITSEWINGTYNFYFILLNSPEFNANLILDIITSNNTNLSNIVNVANGSIRLSCFPTEPAAYNIISCRIHPSCTCLITPFNIKARMHNLHFILIKV